MAGFQRGGLSEREAFREGGFQRGGFQKEKLTDRGTFREGALREAGFQRGELIRDRDLIERGGL